MRATLSPSVNTHRRRKVRATQSTVLPNGKAPNIRGQKVPQKIYRPEVQGKGEKVR